MVRCTAAWEAGQEIVDDCNLSICCISCSKVDSCEHKCSGLEDWKECSFRYEDNDK